MPTGLRYLVLAVIGAGLHAPSALGADATCFLRSALPRGSYRAESFTLGIPNELAGVQSRFADAVARKQSWFQAYVAKLNLQPGEPLPYHEQMEVSRAEYEALTKAYERPAIIPLQTIEIRVDCANGITRLHAKAPHDFLGQVEIDSSGVLHGPFQLKCGPEAVKSRRARFGTWSGTTWLLESGNVDRGDVRHFEFTVGKLDESGRLVLVFNHSLGERGKRLASDQLLAWLTPLRTQ